MCVSVRVYVCFLRVKGKLTGLAGIGISSYGEEAWLGDATASAAAAAAAAEAIAAAAAGPPERRVSATV